MCGIVGIVRRNGADPKDPQYIEQMLQAQHHRGPDATGRHAISLGNLGHNRLSILDLSASADQPFHYHNVTLVFNGEVYNYVELREELQALGHSFTTTGDTEVICAAYLAWGQDCVTRFVGMWAFALWDNTKEELFCSRDRFGIKPFNYIFNDGDFIFASELKTLKIVPEFDDELNKQQVARGLNLGFSGYKDETYYQQVAQLRGAHNLVWKNGNIIIKRYWDLEKVPVPETEAEAITQFKTLWQDSLRLHMRSDVPIGSCLSGGIDSSAIVASIAKEHSKLDYKTFTIFYEGKGAVDERPFAKLLNERYKNIDSKYEEPSDTDLEKHFDHFLSGVDIPPAGSSYYSQYFVMKLASKSKMKVLINGQGSDEYLIGYMHTYYRILADCLRAGQISQFIKTLTAHKKEHKVGLSELLKTIGMSFLLVFMDENKFMQLELKQKHKKQVGLDYSENALYLENKYQSRTDNFLYHLLMTTTLPTLLHFEDRNSMAFSIESRVPFLDHRLVAYGFSLPVKWRLKNGETKYILREAMQDVLPEAIYKRKDKKGFVTPGEKQWVDGPLRSRFTRLSDNIHLNWRLNMLKLWRTRN
jgi:asparagine synthase (glutamine-hydrolysing)